jgi:predicted CopG family antitoxin
MKTITITTEEYDKLKAALKDAEMSIEELLEENEKLLTELNAINNARRG